MLTIDDEAREAQLLFPDGSEVTGQQLHDRLVGLGLRGYRCVQEGPQTSLTVSVVGDHGAALAAVRNAIGDLIPPDVRIEAVSNGFTGVTIEPVRIVYAYAIAGDDVARTRAAIPSRFSVRRHGDVLVGAADPEDVNSFIEVLDGGAVDRLDQTPIRGLEAESNSRLLFQLPREPGLRIHVDAASCAPCDVCADLCPTDAISVREGYAQVKQEACISCQLCGEFCPTDAIRPYEQRASAMHGGALRRLFDTDRAPQRPPYVRARARGERPPIVLGLATVTLMEHAAALLIDGELVSAIEEERLVRERHYRFRIPGRPGASLASDASIPLDGTWPKNAIEHVLKSAGITFDDVDLIAMNGMPHRLRHSFSMTDASRPPRSMRTGRLLFLPHHLCHAASAYGMSELEESWILTVDGHGDVETLGWYWASGDDIERLESVLFTPDRTFGGVFDTVTQLLGFGTHGQGSTMALAALGTPRFDFSSVMRITEDGSLILSEDEAHSRFAHLARSRDEPLTQDHKDLAASLQHALEETLAGWIRIRTGKDRLDKPLCVAGGVGLSCRNNGEMRRRFEPPQMVVAPGANDAGTAIGAAILGHRELTGSLARIDGSHSYHGPSWSDDAIQRLLDRAGIPHDQVTNPSSEAASRLAAGEVICWFQGRMEFGPRALGGRSILADPRRSELKARVNAMKSRQSWRPFGPSILACHQGDWFEEDWDSRFMLFAVNVRADRRERIPVVVHDDGSTRPQVVHAETNPRYHALIASFHAETGVPMVVNTSFNRGGEPIVMTPLQALKSFAGLGADALVMGSSIVTRDHLRRRR